MPKLVENNSGDMIKLAWKNMMDYYNQIRRRYDRAIAAGLNPPESKWQFYHMMHFTRQDKPPVKRKYNWMQPSKVGLYIVQCTICHIHINSVIHLIMVEFI